MRPTDRPARRVAAAAAVLLASTACGGDDAVPTAAELDGSSYEVRSIDAATIVAGSRIVFSFVDGLLSLEAGCNRQAGDYDVDDGTLVVGPMMSTMMACDDALMSQDALMAEIFTARPSVDVDDDRLTLTTSSATVVADEVG